ncbi:GntR family transcriptional regulator [Sebaldella sp. S0638]|uniref:GntR family transcriptional regulator n=1 Tax=Sebaldella sp. S0638 TaxID=2957809 RepID=UPI00209CEA46|nr:GntR family transcriptional regulator [Sebaldella sp. S0638]MCP1223928.1 GntR family transcriptional regulator [Sebaldella sp. S0638]
MEKKHKYLEIKVEIKNDILNKKYEVGEKIPSERELASLYNVTRVTVQKAMNNLEQEGFIERVHGKGMFVLKNTEGNIYIFNNEKSDSVLGFSREFKNKVKISSGLIDFEIIKAGKELAKLLEIETGEEVYYIRRVRLIDDVPVTVEDTNIPLSVINEIPKEVLIKGSLYEYIEKTTGKKIKDSDTIIEASLFTDELAKFLKIKAGHPMLKMTEVTRLEDKTVFNYSYSYNRGDIFRVKNLKIEK